MAQEGQDSVADEVDGRLVPGDQEEEEHGDQLGLAEVSVLVVAG
jgi:hypothetical protein